jgi:ribosomal protein L9
VQVKELSLAEVSLLAEQQEKQSAEAMAVLRQQWAQEKGLLKEQLLHCQNHIAKLERKIADGVRKEQCLHGKIKKYEVCLDAKRNMREIEKEELERINLLLNLPS